MKLTMLGTGHAVVTRCYNTCFVLEENQEYFLVDGGGGNTLLRQLERAHIDFKDIHTIFVTHKHLDHLTGIFWMLRMVLSMMAAQRYEGNLVIYSHDEVIDILEDMVYRLFSEKMTQFVGNRVVLQKVNDQDKKMIIGHEVTFFDIHSTKAKQFGFMIKYNNQRLTCLGDEPYHDHEKQYVENATWLMHEAFCLYSQRDIYKPYEKHHSTVKDACLLANKMNVENLILYHSEDDNILKRKELYRQEGSIYKGKLYIPDDLEVITL